MADTKITGMTDIVALASTDVIPVGRPGNTTAYKATMTEIGAFASAYVSDNLTGLDNPITIGTAGSVEGKLTLATLDGYGAAHGFTFAVDQATFSGNLDDILFIGWNRNAIAGGRIDATKHSIAVGYESYYWVGAGEQYTEWYVEYYAADGITARRPFQTSINLATNSATNMMAGNIHIFYSDALVQWWAINGGALYSYGNPIVQQTNNVNFIRQMNATGTGYKDIYLNSANQWTIAADITTYNDIIFNHSVTTGPVVMTPDGAHLYRLGVDNSGNVISTHVL